MPSDKKPSVKGVNVTRTRIGLNIVRLWKSSSWRRTRCAKSCSARQWKFSQVCPRTNSKGRCNKWQGILRWPRCWWPLSKANYPMKINRHHKEISPMVWRARRRFRPLRPPKQCKWTKSKSSRACSNAQHRVRATKWKWWSICSWNKQKSMTRSLSKRVSRMTSWKRQSWASCRQATRKYQKPWPSSWWRCKWKCKNKEEVFQACLACEQFDRLNAQLYVHICI